VRNRRILVGFVSSLLLSLSPLAAAPVIERGIDVFTTAADGKTSYDFARNPIPAGFFCKSSKPFSGRIQLKGLPLATEIAGQLEGADTVVERLDDAVFDDYGRAMTRIQFRALSLVSIAPLKTSCGAFHTYISLSGKQRVTTMNLQRTQAGGGSFTVPVAVDIRMTFIPVKPARGQRARNLELTGSFIFPARPIPWSFVDSAMTKSSGPVVVDTNGDLAPDAWLPGTSNFLPGRSPGSRNKATYCCPEEVCHYESPGCAHCTVTYPAGCQGHCP